MQIALLSIHTSPLARLGGKEAGGLNVYVAALAHALGQRGVTVDIFTRRHDPANPLSPATVALAPHIQLIYLPAGPAAPYDKNRILDHLPDLFTAIDGFATHHQRHYAVIHSHYWVSGVVALVLREHWQVPVLQMFHTLGALKNQVARGAEETETLRRIEIERNLLQHVDLTVAATELDRAQMVQHYAAPTERIRIVPPGVDITRFRPIDQAAARQQLGLSPTKQLVLGVGRMEPLKGFDALIEALARLQRNTPNQLGVELLLIGGGDEAHQSDWNSEQRRLDTLRHQFAVADRVHFVGAQPHERLPLFYAAADVFVMPSHYESFGMAALEALACGTPVIAANVGGLRTLIVDGQHGLLTPPHAPSVLAEKLTQLLADAPLRERLQVGALQRAATYSWAQITDQIYHIYQELSSQNQKTKK